MLFNSFSFLYFFITVFFGSAILRRYFPKGELWFLVFASAFFYGQWSWKYLLLIYTTITVDYLLGLQYIKRDRPQRFLLVSLWVNLGILAIFKYFNFLTSSVNFGLEAVGSDWSLPMVELLLPVGISFYTFQSLSYMIDIHRGELKPRKHFRDYALFVSFFPQLVAGPIVRASEFFEQLDLKRHFSLNMYQSGWLLILIGLTKKVVFADNLALFVDPVFDNPGAHSGFVNLMAVYGFAFQIYFDFSGYSDMAIGLAKLLGFTFPRNFAHPYVALSIQDFWRRWHMTLSRWLRDYLYISLGGNRHGANKTMRNLFLTMFLGGLWHGASWNFAIWGVLHGVYLAIGRLWSQHGLLSFDTRQTWFKLLKWFWVFHLVCLAWIFFRASELSESITVITQIGTMAGQTRLTDTQWLYVGLILCFPLFHWVSAKVDLSARNERLSTTSYVSIQVVLMLLLVFFSATQSDSFMYFQF